MKYYHPIGEKFKYTDGDKEPVVLVARECETIHDDYWNEDFRKTCEGCVFHGVRWETCSGHRYCENKCKLGGCKAGKCTPEYREDGKFIHYKRVVKKSSPSNQ